MSSYRSRGDEDRGDEDRRDEGNAEYLIAADDSELADAEQAIAAGAATPEQQRKIRTDAILRQTHEYCYAWENFANSHPRDEITALRELEQKESSYPERGQPPQPKPPQPKPNKRPDIL